MCICNYRKIYKKKNKKNLSTLLVNSFLLLQIPLLPKLKSCKNTRSITSNCTLPKKSWILLDFYAVIFFFFLLLFSILIFNVFSLYCNGILHNRYLCYSRLLLKEISLHLCKGKRPEYTIKNSKHPEMYALNPVQGTFMIIMT